MGNEINMTTQTLKVLKPFLEKPTEQIAGITVIRQSGLSSGTAYPIMLRLERQGLLTSKWEDGDPSKLGRPRRRYYTITPRGVTVARQTFSDLTIPQEAAVEELPILENA